MTAMVNTMEQIMAEDPAGMLITEQWPAPAVATWKVVAETLSSGLGSIPVSAIDGPGLLQVCEGESIFVTYIDADDGEGGTVTDTFTWTVNNPAPVVNDNDLYGNSSYDFYAYNFGETDTATVSIARTTDANEAGPVNGVFTVTLSTPAVSDTDISYTVGGTATEGTDYANLSNTVRIDAGTTTAIIEVKNINQDSLIEGTETVTVTLTGITASDPGITIDAANDSDSIDVLDGDAAQLSIAGTTDGNEAGPVDGVFTVTQTTAAVSGTVISYAVGGTATAGT